MNAKVFEVIPSPYIIGMYKNVGFHLTDTQRATLIWNHPNETIDNKIACLKELAEITDDNELRSQIESRIEFEEEMLRRFKENKDRIYVFVVIAREYSAGYFADYEMAKMYALKYIAKISKICECEIEKHHIDHIVYDGNDLKAYKSGKWNPPYIIENIPGSNMIEEYAGLATAYMTLSENGIMDIWSNEMRLDEKRAVDDDNPDRFESQYSVFPFVGIAGTPVRYIFDKSDDYRDYGILLTDTEKWNEFIRRNEARYVDFSDICVTVCYLTEQGFWSHRHIHPWHLDYDVYPTNFEKGKAEAYVAAMKAFSDYWRFRKNEDEELYAKKAIDTAVNYRNACLKAYVDDEKRKSSCLEGAKNIQDIIR